MNKLVFRVAVSEGAHSDFVSAIPGLLVCGFGRSLEETLENTRNIISSYINDSVTASTELGLPERPSFHNVTWHQLEIVR